MGSSTGVRSLEHTPLNASLFMTAPRVAARTFQDLVVWRKAHELVLAVYSLTAGFPKEETYGLALQMRRAAVSVPANIAEGRSEEHTSELQSPMYLVCRLLL